jgi:hypothetical protein
MAEVACCFGMLEPNQVAWKYELLPLQAGKLTIWHNLPFEKVWRAVYFKSLVECVGVDAPLRRQWPILGWSTGDLHLLLHVIHRNMKITIVLGIEKHDVIVINDRLALLPVVVPLVQEEGDPLRWWFGNQFNLLASPIDLWCLFGMLKVHARIFVSQLNLRTIKHLLAKHLVNPVLVASLLKLDSLFKHFKLLLLSSQLLHRLLDLRDRL